MKWIKRLFIFIGLGVTHFAIIVPPTLAACKPGPIEEITATQCTRTDPEWATLKLSNGDDVDYRAFYITYPDEKFSPDDERKIMARINPCATVSLNQKVQLRKSHRCCDPNKTDYRVKCEEVGNPWYEPPDRKKFKVVVAPEAPRAIQVPVTPLVNRFGSAN